MALTVAAILLLPQQQASGGAGEAAPVWQATGRMRDARYAHTSSLLSDGRVLVAGGLGNATPYLSTAEVYDPNAGRWTDTGSMPQGRAYHGAVSLPDGRTFVIGGIGDTGGTFPENLTSVEAYDAVTATWTEMQPMVVPRSFHTATVWQMTASWSPAANITPVALMLRKFTIQRRTPGHLRKT